MKKVFILTLGLIVGSVSLNAMDLMLERYSSLQGISSMDRSIIEGLGDKKENKSLVKDYYKKEDSIAKMGLKSARRTTEAIVNIDNLKNKDTKGEMVIRAFYRGLSNVYNGRYGNLQIKASSFLFKDGEISNSLTYYNVFWVHINF